VSAAQQQKHGSNGNLHDAPPPQEVDESTRYKPLDLEKDRPSQPALIPGAQNAHGTGQGPDITRSQPLAHPGAGAQAPGAFDPAAMGQQQGYPPPGALPPGMVGVGGSPPHPGAQAGAGQGWGAAAGNGAAMMHGQPMPGQVAQTAGGATSPIAKLKNEFLSFSPVKRAALVLMVIALPVGGLLLFSEDEAPPPKPKPAASAASAAASASAMMAAANAAASSGAAPPVVNTQASVSAQAAGSPPPSGGSAPTPPPAAGGGGGGKPGAPDPAASVVGKLPSEMPPLMTTIPMPAKKSTERSAADAVVEGKFGDAARLYDQLAQQNPGNPAYKEAARIMREASKGSPGQ